MLQGDLWREEVVLSVAPDGVIESIEQGTKKTSDKILDGIVIAGMPGAGKAVRLEHRVALR